jgi:hypothetical protein
MMNVSYIATIRSVAVYYWLLNEINMPIANLWKMLIAR